MNKLIEHDAAPKLRGHWKLEVYRDDLRGPDNLLDVIEGDNLVVTLGKQIMLNRLYGINGPPGAMSHMGVGTDSTAAVVGQNKLNPTVAGSVDFNAFDSTATLSILTVTTIATWATGDGNFIWNELGLANSATNDGTHLFNRIIIGPFTKTSAVSIVVTLTITAS